MSSYCTVCRASKPFVANVCQSCGAANTKDYGPFVPRYPPCPKCNGGAFRVRLLGNDAFHALLDGCRKKNAQQKTQSDSAEEHV